MRVPQFDGMASITRKRIRPPKAGMSADGPTEYADYHFCPTHTVSFITTAPHGWEDPPQVGHLIGDDRGSWVESHFARKKNLNTRGD
jgi:hypothetical protein